MKTCLLSALIATTALSAPAFAATIDEAQSAYGIYDVNKAETLYRAVAVDDSASDRDRGIARRELARIAWLVDADGAAARLLLAESLPSDPDPCPAALLYARVLNDVEPEATRAAVAPFVEPCLDIEPGVAIQSARALLLEALTAPKAGRVAGARRALAAWKALPAAARSGLSGARLRLSIGLVAEDPAEALAGWRDYFWLEADRAAPQAFAQSDAEVRAAFAEGVPSAASPEAALTLASLLMRGGFYDDLRRYVEDRGLRSLAATHPDRWKPVATYLEMREAFGKKILAHDRLYARSPASAAEEAAYGKELQGIYAATAAKLGDAASDPMPALYRAFGLWGTAPGRTNGVMGIHLGHAVIDERQKVTQGSRTGSIRFISIDNMVHNSFSGWLMDGQSAPGGWAEEGKLIVQVRPRYLESIDTMTALVHEGPARTRALAQIERQRETDRVIAQKTPIAYLPGARARMRLRGLEGLAAAVRARLAPGEDFAPAFRKALWDALHSTSITAHEGRHALDQAEFEGTTALPNVELEYRAKLSEVGFAEHPRIALASIYGPLFGGESGHGIANRRLLGEYARWIDAHRTEIDGYDPSLTALEQLDKLTDDQLRAVVHALDPAIP